MHGRRREISDKKISLRGFFFNCIEVGVEVPIDLISEPLMMIARCG